MFCLFVLVMSATSAALAVSSSKKVLRKTTTTQKSTAPTKSPNTLLVNKRLQVSGVVSDSLTGRPIPGAKVFLMEETKYYTADVNGQYKVEVDRYFQVSATLSAVENYYKVFEQKVDVSSGSPLIVNFFLEPKISQNGLTLVTPDAKYKKSLDPGVTIRVIDKTGTPVSGLTVLALYSSMGGKTDLRGTMKLRGIDRRYPDVFRISLLDYDLPKQFAESKNEYTVFFVPGYVTTVTLQVTSQ